jgi:hypothetical protein
MKERWMAETRHALYTREFLEQARAFTDAPGTAGDAAATDDYRAALAQAERLALTADHLRQAILRDVLADGADWWQVAESISGRVSRCRRVNSPGCARRLPSTPPKLTLTTDPALHQMEGSPGDADRSSPSRYSPATMDTMSPRTLFRTPLVPQ